ncbi:MAG TPA: IS256 family transposase, partial [Nocardioidaceae bacterium]|nr:IS256 family transposase [Nocardioidaceae bacterium]
MEHSESDSPLGDPGGPPRSARAAVTEMVEAGLFDHVFEGIDEGGLQLTGQGGFLPEM